MKDQISKSYMEEQKAKHAAKPLKDFHNREALIIGASDGPNIGSNIASKLRQMNIKTNQPKVIEFDVTKLNDKLNYHYSDCDILVCSNGYTKLDWFEDQNLNEIDKMFDINVIGSLKAANVFVNGTIDKPYKKYIVFIGSMAYKNVLNGSSIYCASKAALAHATRCLAWELAPKGFNVFCVHPSNTEGAPMSDKTIADLIRYRKLNLEQAKAYWGAVLPKNKWLQPENIADVVAFLVSGKADYMSGSNVELAGGQR